MAYGSPLSLFGDQNDLSSDGKADEKNEYIQDAFNSLFLKSIEMEYKQLKKECKEIVQKINFLE